MLMPLLEPHNWLWWIVIGGIAGALAKLLTPGRDPSGCIITILIGIAGAFLGGWIFQQIGLYDRNQGAGFVAALVGSIVILLLYRLVARVRT